MIIEKGQIFDDVNNLLPTKCQLEAFLLFRTVAGLTASNIGNSGLRFFYLSRTMEYFCSSNGTTCSGNVSCGCVLPNRLLNLVSHLTDMVSVPRVKPFTSCG